MDAVRARLSRAVESTLQLAPPGPQLSKLYESGLQKVGAELEGCLTADDEVSFCFPSTFDVAGAARTGVVVLTADRLVLAWTQGNFAAKPQSIEIYFDDVSEVVLLHRRMTRNGANLDAVGFHYDSEPCALILFSDLMGPGLAPIVAGAIKRTSSPRPQVDIQARPAQDPAILPRLVLPPRRHPTEPPGACQPRKVDPQRAGKAPSGKPAHVEETDAGSEIEAVAAEVDGRFSLGEITLPAALATLLIAIFGIPQINRNSGTQWWNLLLFAGVLALLVGVVGAVSTATKAPWRAFGDARADGKVGAMLRSYALRRAILPRFMRRGIPGALAAQLYRSATEKHRAAVSGEYEQFVAVTAPDGSIVYVAAPRVANGRAVASLLFGIFWLGGLGSIVAIIMGHSARAEMRKQRRGSGDGMALAGLILGYLGIASTAFYVILFFRLL